MIDPYEQILYKMCNGDLSKAELIEGFDRDRCYRWLYYERVSEVNEMKAKIEELRTMQKNKR